MATRQSKLNAKKVLHKAISEANALYSHGNIKQALVLTQKALLQFPKNPTLLRDAGGFAGMLNDFPSAENYTRQSLAILPNDADLHNNLGLLLYKQDHFEQAGQCYQTALKLKPNHVGAHNNLGWLLQQQQHFDQAKQHYQTVLKLKPNHVGVHNNLGWLLKEQQHLDEAKQHYQIALKLNPNHVGAHNNLGLLLSEQQHLDEAKQHYQIALKLNPNHVEVHYNLGLLLKGQRHFDESIQHYQTTLKLDPSHVGAKWNLSLLLLVLGRLSEAWPGYEYRWHLDKSKQKFGPPSGLAIPEYQGQILMGKSLLIVCEQGFGDNIQCIRYLPLLKRDKGVKYLVLACHAVLIKLFNSVDCIDEVVNEYAMIQAQSLDYWVFIMSLPLYFNTVLETIPNQFPYLFSPKEQQNQWQKKLPKDSFNIGLVWKGQAKHKNDTNRSIDSLSILRPLWQLKGKQDEDISFISLQKGEGEIEAANPPPDQPMIHLGTQIQDFADSAAIVSQLDLVISVDTAIVHLAGSFNIPCWVLLPYNQDWRWLIDREDSPWYPNSIRLFRQKTQGDWCDEIRRVVVALDEAVNNTKAKEK